MPNPTSKYITQINGDDQLNVAMQNFGTVCSANAAALGLTPAQVLEITGTGTSYTGTLNTWVSARASADNSRATKDTQKRATKAVVSKYAKIFRANLTVSDALLEQLMLPHHKTPGTKTPPETPTNLVASADGQGLVTLKWKRGNNIGGTVFVIETRSSNTSEWVFLANSTRVRFQVQETPGEYVSYRVSATRDKKTSPPSTAATLWDDGGAGLKVAA